MLISDYLSSNTIICIFFFDPFERPRAEIVQLLVQMKNEKFTFKII